MRVLWLEGQAGGLYGLVAWDGSCYLGRSRGKDEGQDIKQIIELGVKIPLEELGDFVRQARKDEQ